MTSGRLGVAFVLAAGIGCAHVSSRPEKPSLAAGKYAVESIRSRAQLDGADQFIEISESSQKKGHSSARSAPIGWTPSQSSSSNPS